MYYIRYTFPSNHNVHKSSCSLCFCAPDSFIDGFLIKSINQRFLSQKTKATRSFMNVVTCQKSISCITYLYGKYQILCTDTSCLKIELILFISICVRTMEDKNWLNILGIHSEKSIYETIWASL